MAAPGADEVELSAFGPGYGECVLVHLGQGDWMIVDSCVGANDAIPVLDYLRSLGVDPAAAVKLVVATHWHDDHVRGISEIVRVCDQARFACSGVLSAKELIEGIGSLTSRKGFEAPRTTSGVAEMSNTLSLLASSRGRPTAEWTLEGQVLFERRVAPGCSVRALAPAHPVLTRAHQQISSLLEQATSRRVPRPELNRGAIVLWVEVADLALLLGSDLQETRNPETGWTAVCDCPVRLPGRADVFKVPHHGSKNGHQPRVWDEMLVVSPEAVVCPNSLAGNHLPTAEDIQRLCQLGRVHLTAPPGPGSSIRRGRRSHLAAPTSGRVTLRRHVQPDAQWRATYDPPAADPCRSPASATAGTLELDGSD